ncbi:RNA polymerase sigma factor RpoS [Mycobacteroides abscessus subsp. abscessus]|nr:RNA polymerase sigma factor RpoS [Mycobacteroides abscessus subsp. abscessus]SIC89827.1 RNA polymerase sigma factor RpoS [Mycobacteroides abscessus subsp. abscessus]SID09993.1 RNA polymerase sigma factor RpoS [Mycobacteroides abscessus subsp. abscessus]SKW00684.1 RNA polymerase sigma factor RpoS [Mycobacteroides abscessus subsp. abscessus]SKW02283.1 RNA polymerase sigma factor RpoS [Mycobacteroides abscessus subsp. abscessus]
MSAVAGTLGEVDKEPGADRRGAPWTSQDIAELVDRVRGGAGRGDLARGLGRTHSAIESAVWRLLPQERRPEAKSQSVQLLREVLNTDTGGGVDWWARYVQGRAEVRSARAASPRQRERTKGGGPLPEVVQAFAEQPAVVWEPLDGHSEIGPLITQGVAEISDPRKRYIMACRLGLIEGPNTLADIGSTLSITGERVRQLQNAAIMQMQRDAARPGSAGATLAVIFDFLDHNPAAVDVLTQRLLGEAEEFRCDPFWLIKTVSRIGGRSGAQAETIAAAAAALHQQRRRLERERAQEQRHVAACDRIVDRWIGAACWPPRPGARPAGVARQRMPAPSKSAVFGSYTSQKTGGEIYFESLLEESVFLAAEGSSRVRSYQEQPCQIRYVGEDRIEHTYYPDLVLTLDDGRVLLVEVKPLWQMALTSNRIKCGAGQRYAAENGWGWVSVGSRGQTFRDLEERDIDEPIRACLMAAMAEGPVSWTTLQQLRLQTPITAMDVAAFAVQDNAGLALTPYRLYHISDI